MIWQPRTSLEQPLSGFEVGADGRTDEERWNEYLTRCVARRRLMPANIARGLGHSLEAIVPVRIEA